MRLFIGTFVKNTNIKSKYIELKRKIKAEVEGKWVEPWNLHFTYHFLGEVQDKDAKKIFKQIQHLCIEYSNELVFTGLNVFPNKQNPRILFIEIVDANSLLKKIHFDLGSILVKNGVKIEDKDFHPHLTLLRIKHCNRKRFQDFLENYDTIRFGSISNFKVDLIQSILTTEGPKYSPISF